MRLSDLLGTPVVDEDGHELGIVHDVAAVQDGPIVGAFGAALRVESLIVGTHGLWVRLGLARSRVDGPGLLPRRRAATDEVPWERVRSVTPDRIVVAAPDRHG